MFISLKNCLESAETIEVENSRARLMLREVLPMAVGPTIQMRNFLFIGAPGRGVKVLNLPKGSNLKMLLPPSGEDIMSCLLYRVQRNNLKPLVLSQVTLDDVLGIPIVL